MNAFERIDTQFGATWTTVLVGWTGLGVFSPELSWTDFPPLISIDEIDSFAYARLGSLVDPAEDSLIIDLTSELRSATREEIRDMLQGLSERDGGDVAIERRKWRLILLEELLKKISQDPLFGLFVLTEFWQGFGYPPDSPHQVQGRGNSITVAEYYTPNNLARTVARHRRWVDDERADLKALTSSVNRADS